MAAFSPNGQVQVQGVDTVDVNEKYIFLNLSRTCIEKTAWETYFCERGIL
jgi:hypothetical protein